MSKNRLSNAMKPLWLVLGGGWWWVVLGGGRGWIIYVGGVVGGD